MGLRRQKLSKSVLGALVGLLAGGFPADVLAEAEEWAVGGGSADRPPPLVHAFALRVLGRAVSPYSQKCARAATAAADGGGLLASAVTPIQ
jgi:hypothetical protein